MVSSLLLLPAAHMFLPSKMRMLAKISSVAHFSSSMSSICSVLRIASSGLLTPFVTFFPVVDCAIFIVQCGVSAWIKFVTSPKTGRPPIVTIVATDSQPLPYP